MVQFSTLNFLHHSQANPNWRQIRVVRRDFRLTRALVRGLLERGSCGELLAIVVGISWLRNSFCFGR